MQYSRVLNLFCVFLFCWPAGLWAQIYPGDANNNGRVNHADLLYIGYAYGSAGPARIDSSGEFSPQTATYFWPESFPGGPNFIYADANGDGLVTFNDLLTVNYNYGQAQGLATPEQYIVGFEGLHPVLSPGNDPPALPVPQASVVQIPVFLGTVDLPVEQINGLAFSLNYDTDFIAGAYLDFTGSWMNPDQQTFTFQKSVPGGKLEAALTRFGQDPVSGNGLLATLSIVIEDDLIDLYIGPDSLETFIDFDELIGRDSLFQVLPLVHHDIRLMIYNPDRLVSGNPDPGVEPQLKIFPNPSTGRLFIQSNISLEEIQLIHTSGIVQNTWEPDAGHQTSINLETLPPGVWILKLKTRNGFITRKIMKL